MTDKEKYEALVAEIEHQKEETSIGLNEWENGEEHGRMEVINALQEKIKSMQGEPANDDFEKEMNDFFLTMQVQDNEYINEDTFRSIARHFAEWQKQQMMKDAVEATLYFDYGDKTGFYGMVELHDIPMKDMEDGDKVKVLVIKEE